MSLSNVWDNGLQELLTDFAGDCLILFVPSDVSLSLHPGFLSDQGSSHRSQANLGSGSQTWEDNSPRLPELSLRVRTHSACSSAPTETVWGGRRWGCLMITFTLAAELDALRGLGQSRWSSTKKSRKQRESTVGPTTCPTSAVQRGLQRADMYSPHLVPHITSLPHSSKIHQPKEGGGRGHRKCGIDIPVLISLIFSEYLIFLLTWLYVILY